MRRLGTALGRSELETFEELTGRVDAPTRSIDWLAGAMFEFDRVEDLLVLTETRGWAEAGPVGRYWAACAHYVTHEFAAARRELAHLRGTGKQWDADKLEARLCFEEGRFIEAVENRAPRAALRTSFDEVLYYSRLRVDDLPSTFATYAHWSDRQRLRRQFGERAWTDVRVQPSGPPRRAFVIAQDGPGDEIAMAATYAQLLGQFDAVTATCEPRLHSVLKRSFPQIEFLPTARQSSRPTLGFLGTSAPPRQADVFFDLLDRSAAAAARAATSVILSRSLIGLTQQGSPFPAYLAPDLAPAAATRSQAAAGIGLTWRSEYTGGMRRVHYLRVDDLAPLAKLDARFVNLQYDATAEERATLRTLFGARLIEADHVDIRNDFESTATLLSSLSAVVGVGTTTVELAGALGVSTIYLNPNQWGQWRRLGEDRDYWHASTRLACASSPQRRGECVDRATEQLVATGVGRLTAGTV
jgi:hypothetical protein